MSNTETDSKYLVDISTDSTNHPVLVLFVCPVCSEKLFDDIEECKHSHPEKVASHISSHTPSDLDLDSYRYRPMADILIERHNMNKHAES